MRRAYSRRELLRIGSAGAVAGLAGCSDSIGGSGTSLESQLEEVESATAEFSEPQAALGAGFQVAGPVAPGQGWHLINEERVQAAAENGPDRSKPQVLTYDTDRTLVAVEWAVPSEAASDDLDLFADGDAEATEEWHSHGAATHVLATGDGEATDPGSIGFEAMMNNDNWSAFLPPNPDLSHGDEVALEWGVESGRDEMDEGEQRVVDIAATHPSLETLHVWVHKENPEGVFHSVHPDVAGGSEHDH